MKTLLPLLIMAAFAIPAQAQTCRDSAWQEQQRRYEQAQARARVERQARSSRPDAARLRDVEDRLDDIEFKETMAGLRQRLAERKRQEAQRGYAPSR